DAAPPVPAPAGALPPSAARRGRRKVLLGAAALLLLPVALLGVSRSRSRSHPHNEAGLPTRTVRYERLDADITERGELEAARHFDVHCQVKAGARNSTIATTIKWVIDDGSLVKKGNLLIELDNSGLQEQHKEQRITLDRATADKVLAEENFKIVESQ